MVKLIAKLWLKGENENPFTLNVTPIGSASFGVTVDREEIIDRHNLLSLSANIQSKSNLDSPSFGVISNSGEISFGDYDSLFLTAIQNGYLRSGDKIEFFLNNTLTKEERKVGEYYAADWDYDNDAKSVSVRVKDDLEEWQDLLVERIELFDIENPRSRSMEDIYKALYEQTPTKYSMLPFNELDEETKDIISATTIGAPNVKSSNLWANWNKFCQNCGTKIYKNMEGKTVCKYVEGF